MSSFKFLALFTFSLIAFPAPVFADHTAKTPARQIVEHYADAYNEGNAEVMGQYMHDDIQWITIEDATSSITTQGKEKLVKEMKGYFQSPGKVSSSLHGWNENGAFVSVIETASWTTKSGSRRSQSANAVYQLEDNLIRRVWYFPAQQQSE